MSSNNSAYIGIGVTVAVCTIAASYFYLGAKKLVNVEGILKCSCGKVTAKISAPRSTPTATCHCKDCTGIVKWSKEERKSTNNVR